MLDSLMKFNIFKRLLLFNLLIYVVVWFNFSFDGYILIWFLSTYFVMMIFPFELWIWHSKFQTLIDSASFRYRIMCKRNIENYYLGINIGMSMIFSLIITVSVIAVSGMWNKFENIPYIIGYILLFMGIYMFFSILLTLLYLVTRNYNVSIIITSIVQVMISMYIVLLNVFQLILENTVVLFKIVGFISIANIILICIYFIVKNKRGFQYEV